MEKWLKAVVACYGADAESKGNEKLDFSILAGGTVTGAAEILKGSSIVAFGWSDSGNDYILAAGKWEAAEEADLQDKLEDIFNKIIGSEDANLYAAREVVIDDLSGIEVCGGVEFEEGVETILYVLYLTDGKEGYCIVGFGSADAELSFDELAGGSRTFYRLSEPATVSKGKSEEPVFNAIRALAVATLPNEDVDWDILNTTFEVEEGKFINTPSVVAIFENEANHADVEDIFGEKDFTQVVGEFTGLLPQLYDISGFTITNFKDGRYSVTYYPIFDDEGCGDDCDCGGDCGDDCDCDHDHKHEHKSVHVDGDEGLDLESINDIDELGDDAPELEPDLVEMGTVISKAFDGNWKHGMGLLTSDGEYFSLAIFHSDGGSLVSPEIPDELDEELTAMINGMVETLDDGFSGWNALGFAFEKDEETGDIEESSMRYEVFDFDIYIDATDDEDEIPNETKNLYPIADLFYEELNESDLCVSAITFRILSGDSGFFVIEPATASTPEGIIYIKSFESNLPKIYNHIEEILLKNEDCNTVTVTLFPDGKVGFNLEYVDEPLIIDRKNLKELLIETDLIHHEDNIKNILRDEIVAKIYEIDVEESIMTGVSKIGGMADLPIGYVYPKSTLEKPMTFIAQVNLADVSAFDKEGLLPKDGLLSFFYHGEGTECRVIYSSLDEVLESAIPLESIDEVEEFLAARLRFAPSVSLPLFSKEDDKNSMLSFLKTEEEEEMYVDVASCAGKMKIFGFADTIEKEQEENLDDNMVLLLQVPSVDVCDMNWGDDGSLYFWISKEDLKAGRFDNCRCIMQSY